MPANKYEAIRIGDPAAAVQEALGEPDADVSHTLSDFAFFYFRDDIEVRFEKGRVSDIKRGVPTGIKEQAGREGKHLIGRASGEEMRATFYVFRSS